MNKRYLSFFMILTLYVTAEGQPQILSYTSLEDFLPQSNFGGFVRGKATGETSSMMGFSTSWAQVIYDSSSDSGKAILTLRITDMLNLPSFTGINPNINKTTATGYEKTVNYRGSKVLEAFDSSIDQAKLQFFFVRRFLIEVNGYHVVDVSPLYRLLDMANLDGLRKMTQSSLPGGK